MTARKERRPQTAPRLAAGSIGYSAIPLYVSRHAGFVEAALVMLGLALVLPLIVLAVLARGSPAS